MNNQPKLSKRAQQALELLANGGRMVHALERDGYTGREKFKTRFKAAENGVVGGLGSKTRYELEDAGFRFKPVYSLTGYTEYALDHSA